jgi:ubiquinone/menaquinone biosynthesis C-methylase UbiE
MKEATAGRILHRAAGYDWLVWLITGGRERKFRNQLLALARVQPGESVLDIACGTGSLAIAAKRCVGPDGAVHGIDASPAMIRHAAKKARRAGMGVLFQEAAAEALPFPDGRFDVVLSTVMLHHVPRAARTACAREMYRVTKPGGRVFVVDFGEPFRHRHSLISRVHRHGYTDPDEVRALLVGAGMEIIESGSVGIHDLHFALAVHRVETRR